MIFCFINQNSKTHPSASTTSSTKSKTTVIQTPVNLEIRTLIRENPIPVKVCAGNIHQQADKVSVILAQILDRSSLKKSLNLALTSSFVSLNAAVLQSLVRDYNVYLDWLEKQGVIECDPVYKKGVHSRTYRLGVIYRGQRTKDYVITDKTIVKKLSQTAICAIAQKRYPNLYGDLINLKIDKKAALRTMHSKTMWSIALQEAGKDISQVNKRRKAKSPYYGISSKQRKRITRRIAQEKINSWKASVTKIDEGQFYFKQDYTSFRIHTSAVSLKKELRKHLTILDQRLVACDIKNSQPYFSIGLFLNPQKYWPLVEGYIRHYQGTHLDWVYHAIKSIMEHKYLSGNLLESTKRYIEYVVSGTFYDFMVQELQKSTGKPWTREEAKLEVLKVLFYPPRFKGLPGREVMKANFPEVLRFFSLVNYGFTQTKGQQTKCAAAISLPNALSRILQRMESEAVIDGVCGALKKTNPEIPLITLHDGIATTIGHQYLVEQKMIEILEQQVGRKPGIEIEWGKWGIGRYP
jgi:hypothetical protein